MVVSAAAQAYDYIGLPEGVYPIVHATLYLATAPKSNTANHYFKAFELIEKDGVGEVPDHLKDANRDGEALGHGQGYEYPHAHPGHHTAQQYLPKDVLGTYFYTPSDQGYEKQVGERLEMWRAAQRKALGITDIQTIPDLTEEEVIDSKRKQKVTSGKSNR